MSIVSDLSREFRAKLGNLWSLCNNVGASKNFSIFFTII